jgi:hypothetical protein
MMPGGQLRHARTSGRVVEMGKQNDSWLLAGDAAVRLAWRLLWSWRRARPPLEKAPQETPIPR